MIMRSRSVNLLVLLCVALVACWPSLADARGKGKKPSRNIYAAIVIDADSGEVIHQDEADKVLHPASLTKIMTLLLVFEALSKKELSSRSSVTVSRYAASMSPSKVGLKPGQSMSVQDAVYSLVTKSANDISVALAEKIGGSEAQFARMMTAKAREIGMNKTRFVNASGLHDPRQQSTARDMATLGRYILKTYPQYYHVFGQKAFRYNGRLFRNHNHLMESYQGMDGIKTGYVAASGFNLVASAKRGNHRLIGVVFGGQSTSSRNSRMADLLDDGFEKVKMRRSVPKNISPTLPVETKRVDPVVPPVLTSPAASTPPPAVPEVPQFAQPIQSAAADPSSSQAFSASPLSNGTWSVQIGAYQSRLATDQALYQAMRKLPSHLARANPLVVPLRTTEATWVFRARLSGFSKDQAIEACKYLSECLPISPQAN